MKRHAVALRDFTHAADADHPEQAFVKGEHLTLDKSHFEDWSADGVCLVRAATAAETKAADKPKADA